MNQLLSMERGMYPVRTTRLGLIFSFLRYVFLGFTESSLKAGHLLFFREGDDFTVETLKENFGNLKPVYEDSGYGKYAARVGMSFSSTIPTEVVCHLCSAPDLAHNS